jgi:hypothetical protein
MVRIGKPALAPVCRYQLPELDRINSAADLG